MYGAIGAGDLGGGIWPYKQNLFRAIGKICGIGICGWWSALQNCDPLEARLSPPTPPPTPDLADQAHMHSAPIQPAIKWDGRRPLPRNKPQAQVIEIWDMRAVASYRLRLLQL
jgi:hypothetical protein